MNSAVIKRSIVIAGHKTSVSLEDAFWQGLKEVAAARQVSLTGLIATIDGGRHDGRNEVLNMAGNKPSKCRLPRRFCGENRTAVSGKQGKGFSAVRHELNGCIVQLADQRRDGVPRYTQAHETHRRRPDDREAL